VPTQEDDMANLGRLKALDPRSVWPHEAHDFTPWLLDNADALAEALGLDLELSASLPRRRLGSENPA